MQALRDRVLASRSLVPASLALALALLGSGLSGCADLIAHDDPLAGSVQACLAQNVHFLDAWGCVQARYAEGQIGEADPRVKDLLKLGDDLASRVAAKKLSDADAKGQLAAGLPAAG